MAQYVLFDGPYWESLFPLTLTRPVCQLRIGGLTIIEKWERILDQPNQIGIHTQEYLRGQFHMEVDHSQDVILINAAFLPNKYLLHQIGSLRLGESIWVDQILIATRTDAYDVSWDYHDVKSSVSSSIKSIDLSNLVFVQYPEHIFLNNGAEIKADFELITKGKQSQAIPDTVSIVGDPNSVFIDEGVEINHAIINCTQGPVYIGSGAVILEGTMMRGPLYIGEKAVIKMGAKVYGETTIGPNCKVGGEIKRSLLYAYSNKGHDGYLGDSVIGEWCNMGADTNTSNMKNTYGHVNLWDIANQIKRNTGEQFCGTIMGDHTRCAINTQLNTGTVIGVFANIFGDPPSAFIDSFSWGASDTYDIDKAINVAKIVHSRKNKKLSSEEENILRYLQANQQ